MGERKGYNMKTYKIVRVEYSSLGQTLHVVENGDKSASEVIRHAPAYPILLSGGIMHEVYDRFTGTVTVATVYDLDRWPYVNAYSINSDSEQNSFYKRMSMSDAAFVKTKVFQAMQKRQMYTTPDNSLNLKKLMNAQLQEYRNIMGR